MELRPFGDAAWRIDELPAEAAPAAVLALLRAWPGVRDAVVADGSALVCFDPLHPPADPREALLDCRSSDVEAGAAHVVRVRYDGADLDEVAGASGLSRGTVIRLHTAPEYRVELVGFLPGFAYLGPLDPALRLPRRPTPRPRVPALSVAIAMHRTGIYPFASPGGWHLLGTAIGFAPFDPTTGSALKPGDRVRFVPEPA